MSRKPGLRLADIVEACSRVASYITGFDADAFARDLKTQDAVIRQFEIIGEAVIYVYILESKKDGLLYTGCTRDLRKRRSELADVI